MLIAAGNFELYKLIILAVVMLGGAVVKKITEAREQAERARTTKPPAARPPAVPPRRETEVRKADAVWTAGSAEPATAARRDNPFRNEIEAFLEEVGRRRSPSGGPQRDPAERSAAPIGVPVARPVARPQPSPAGAQRTVGSAVRAKPEPAKAPPQAAPQTPLARPGAEIAQRKAPVSDDLGAQVRAQLNQYLESSRLSQRARADLGSAIERAVRAHLGTTATDGPELQDSLVSVAPPGMPITTLLRNPNGVRTAILVNEILERPKCLRRKT
jgi:hypothetical protein